MLKNRLIPLLFLLSTTLTFGQLVERTYYRTPELERLNLITEGFSASINDDHMEPFAVREFTSPDGLIYWYRRIATEVCLTGDCRPIDVGIYWDGTGDFAGLEVFKEPLTKTDHSDFSTFDYRRLMSILNDDWSPLREYSLSELVDEKKEDSVDVVSGATKHEIAQAAVEKAVYTTHTLWHLIHVGEKEQLAKLTAARLNDKNLLEKALQAQREKYQPFLLDMFAQGNLPQNSFTESLVLSSLTDAANPTLHAVTLNALQQLDLTQPALQDRLAAIYKNKKQPERVEILTRLRPAAQLSENFYTTLAEDLSAENPWMSVKILAALKHSRTQSPQVLETVKKLSQSDIPVVQKAVKEFESARSVSR
ncbi:hypothetical protein [Dyadobacter sp. Leaf189]|uniref:hypothetical protein n=1 Tax=Dyadobacter sp. Leaf189 TaxID=1736295 RepID=UPI0006FBF6EC|nr:hypothetical protein [Dyadobacter sp. Leaf189]KQS30861.1 hypothetical protein ASG33_10840 [Dyadobacter sp. Leaf189]